MCVYVCWKEKLDLVVLSGSMIGHVAVKTSEGVKWQSHSLVGSYFNILVGFSFCRPCIRLLMHPPIQIPAPNPSLLTSQSLTLLRFHNKQGTSSVETCPIYFASYCK